jgi:hypothetical protein
MKTSSAFLTCALLLLFCSFSQAATPNVTLTQNASTVGRYEIYELTMTNPAVYANTWDAVTITANMKAPSGKNYTVGGFCYDGKNIWKLRFAPMEVGNWTWTLTYNDGAGVFSSSGGFVCSVSNNTGFLRINSTNPSRLMTEGNQKAFYPLGFNMYIPPLHSLTDVVPLGSENNSQPETIADFFQTYSNAGMNIFRDNTPLVISWSGNFNINGSGQNNFDSTLSAQLDLIAMAVHNAGWKFHITFWTNVWLNNFDLSPPGVLQATDSMHRYMINRYGAYVDVWELMNESFPPQSYINTMTSFIHANDPYVHLITMSYPTATQSGLDITSPHLYLGCPNDSLDSVLNNYDSSYQYNKPILIGEAGGGGPSGAYDPERFRLWLWTTFFTYAAPEFWNGGAYSNFTTANAGITNEYIGWEERSASKIFSDFVVDFDPAATPVAATLNPSIQLRCYAMTSSRNAGLYLVHSQDPDSLLSGATVALNIPVAMQGAWIDPKTGESLQTVSVGPGQQSIPVPPFYKDIALRLSAGAPQQPVLQFSTASYSMNNDQNSIAVTVTHTGSTANAISVNYSTSDGLAKAGINYTAISGTISWASNDASPKIINIPLTPQTTMTGNLDFIINLNNPQGGAVLGTTNSAIVNLLNTVTYGAVFSAPTYTVTKGSASLAITVNRTGSGTGPWSCHPYTLDNTAMSGTDYVGIPNNSFTLSWAAGDFAPKTFSIQLLNNSLTGNKWFRVGIGIGQDPKLASRVDAVIVDNGSPSAGILAFSNYNNLVEFGYNYFACSYSVAPSAGAAQLHVSRTSGSSGAASISYQVNACGTAMSGIDFTSVSGTLSWANGDASDKIISIPILNNTLARGTPWFAVELTNISGALSVLPSIAQVFIIDANPPPVVNIVAPSSGTTAGGSQVAISGANFVSGATVSFGSSPATGVYVASDKSIVCKAPTVAAGTVNITVTNPDRQSATFANAYTYVSGGTQPPSITAQPANQTVNAGQVATFSITANGTGLSYQWYKNGTAISGAISVSYTTPATVTADNGSAFYCLVSNAGGSITSSNVTLTVKTVVSPPAITSQPANQTVTAGQTATFSISASGTGLLYNWYKNGNAIGGANLASYTTPAATTIDRGSAFYCVVSNAGGSVTSNSAILTVNSQVETPYGGMPWPVPGSIEAENYDYGGEGIAYHDTSSGNTGGAYRSDDVDIRACIDTNGGNQVGWTNANEWLKYTVNVTATGSYTITERIAAGQPGGVLHVEFDGANLTGSISVPFTGSWDTWQSLTQTISLTAGQHVMRVYIENGGFDMNWFSLSVPTGPNTPTVLTSAASVTPNPAQTGQAVTFSVAAVDDDGDTLTYTWDFGDGSSGPGASATHVYANAGSFTATATISDGGSAVTSSITIMVNGTTGGTAIQINSGGPGSQTFVADTDFSGGTKYATTAPINIASIVNPAPQAVYQSERYGNFTYVIPNLTFGDTYTIRLHFAEIYWNSAGQRLFNVAINGTTVLSNFDIFAAAGGKNIAIVKTFAATPGDAGHIVITYSTLKDNAKSSGVEILSAGALNLSPSVASSITPDSGLSSIDLGTIKLNHALKILLAVPESGSQGKKLHWSPVIASTMPKGVRLSRGLLGGRPNKVGTFNFKLKFNSRGGSGENTYSLTVVE